MDRISLTLRRYRIYFFIWMMATSVGALGGPFGTFALLNFWQSWVYWGAVAGVSVAVYIIFSRYGIGTSADWRRRVSGQAAYAVVLGVIIWGANCLLFFDWCAPYEYFWLVGIIFAVWQAIVLLLGMQRHLIVSKAEPNSGLPDVTEQFLQRIPLEKRGKLIRLEAQDHYLRAVTTAGSDLILMRMSDATAELGEVGIRVHRSHWVANSAVTKAQKTEGKVTLFMSDGAEVPVSRNHLPNLRAAGILPS
jgi:hypothetical protein